VPTETAALLRRAKARIAKPSAWCQGGLARDLKGRLTGHDMRSAVSFCMIGAVLRDEADGAKNDALQLLQAAVRGTVSSFNDSYRREHSDVMAAYDRAIELAEGEEANGP
jgi:hypothetical protein